MCYTKSRTERFLVTGCLDSFLQALHFTGYKQKFVSTKAVFAKLRMLFHRLKRQFRHYTFPIRLLLPPTYRKKNNGKTKN